jgi:deoxyribodipyrimidine photo-lyase
MTRTVIHWFRRDLRFHDNTGLSRAARDAERVVPVFILDDHYAADPNVGPSRFRFLRESLEELDRALARAGGRLLLRSGPASRALPELLAETGAEAVYGNTEVGPYPERRDSEARAAVEVAGARFRLFGDALLVEPDALATAAGDPYTVFTPFLKKWLTLEKRAPEPDPAALATPRLPGEPLERIRAWKNLPPDAAAPRGGEGAATTLLHRFLARPARRYTLDRDFPAREGTSSLSPHLHFGTVSPRAILSAAGEAQTSAPPAVRRQLDGFVRQLAWRDFFHHVLFHFPRVAAGSFRPEFDRLAWRDAPEAVAAWKDGRTGYPFVDAAMRQLSKTHGMHNRARMAAASFLTKDLHVHWREGEKWFERSLADADLANNNGGWQWTAGSGTDAAPYYRIFNPVLQSRKFDPDGAWIRRFVPELAAVPIEKLHEPWTMTSEQQRASRCVIGRDYPAPIVDHARERAEALKLFDAIRKFSRSGPVER